MDNFCPQCGSQRQPDDKFCTICGYSRDQSQDQKVQFSGIEHDHPQGLNKPKHSMGKIIALITAGLVSLAFIIFIVVIISTGYFGSGGKVKPPSISVPGDNSNKGLVVNEMIFEKEQTLSKEGGVILVQNEDSLINGMEIDIGKGSLDQPAAFSISYGEIISHGFDPQLHFITPLFHVDNSVGYTEDAMTVKVPCQVPKDVIPVAFYYHEDDKSLEYIPLVDFDSKSVIIGLRHFSYGGIGYFTKAYIEEIKVIDTGFLPGVDDFSFQNFGSSITPKGHCFGQSIAAIWYYKNLKPSKGSLYGKYDNYTKNPSINFETKTLQFDDVLAYRLASMSQLLFVESPETSQIDWKISRWNAMRTSDQDQVRPVSCPYEVQSSQVLLIQRVDSNKITQNFHAIIAYRAEDNRIYVADPNNPGKNDRYIEIEDGEFKPYNSADNAQDIAAGNSVNYNVFSAFGETAMFDYNKMESLWKELETATVGDTHFSDAGVKLVAKVKNAQGEEEDQEIDPGFTSPSEDLTFVVEMPRGFQKSVYYTDGTGEPTRIIPVDKRYTVKLDKDKDKQGYIGVLIGKDKNWHGFEWFPISLSDITGIYDVTGTIQMTWDSTGVHDTFDKDPLTPFQAQVELKGSEMTITFFNSTSSVLTGTYDKATGKFRGKDNSDMGDDPWSIPVWKLKETTIQFDTEAKPIIAKGITDGSDKDVTSESDDPDKAVVILDLIAEIEMIKVSD